MYFVVAMVKRLKETKLILIMFYLTHYIKNHNFYIQAVKVHDLYLDFIKFTVEKVDFHTQVSPNVLKCFAITESSINFSI